MVPIITISRKVIAPVEKELEMGPAKQETGRTYGVELLFQSPPNLELDELTEALAGCCPQARVQATTSTVMVYHDDAIIPYGDGIAPAQTAIIPTDMPLDPRLLATALEHTWDWPEAGEIVANCNHRMLVTDMMSSDLDHQTRLEKYENTLLAVVETTKPDAIFWRPAGKIVSPDKFIRSMEADNPNAGVMTALNVRMFNIMNGEKDEIVMDTLGLGALMLPDLQVHFSDLNPDIIARHLYNSALFLFENGDIIQDGNTIKGIAPDEEWACTREEALIAPGRLVVDLDPGPPYAAGSRE